MTVSVVDREQPPGGHPEVPDSRPVPKEVRFDGTLAISTRHVRSGGSATGTETPLIVNFTRGNGREEDKGFRSTLAQWKAFVAFARSKEGKWAERVLYYRAGLWVPAQMERPFVDISGPEPILFIPVNFSGMHEKKASPGIGESRSTRELVPFSDCEMRLLPFFPSLRETPMDPLKARTFVDGPGGHAPIDLALVGTFLNTEKSKLTGFEEGDITAVVVDRRDLFRDVEKAGDCNKLSVKGYLIQLDVVRFAFGAQLDTSPGRVLSPASVATWLSGYNTVTLTVEDKGPTGLGAEDLYRVNFWGFGRNAVEQGYAQDMGGGKPSPDLCRHRLGGPENNA